MAQSEKQSDTHEGEHATSQEQSSSLLRARHTSPAEIVISGISLLILIAIIGFLVYQGLQANAPAQLAVEATNVVPYDAGYLVEIELSNRGDRTAESVVVTGELLSDAAAPGGAQLVERVQITFDFVPPQAQRQGGLIFGHNPSDYQLELRTNGYITP